MDIYRFCILSDGFVGLGWGVGAVCPWGRGFSQEKEKSWTHPPACIAFFVPFLGFLGGQVRRGDVVARFRCERS